MNGGLRAPSNTLSEKLSLPVHTSIMGHIMSEKRQLQRSFLANLRVPMLLKRKLRLIRDNNLTKFRRLRGCCGNYGQPGC